MDVIQGMRINVYKRVEIPTAKELFDMYGESPSRGQYTAKMDSDGVPVLSGYQTKLEQVANGSRILLAEVERESARKAPISESSAATSADKPTDSPRNE